MRLKRKKPKPVKAPLFISKLRGLPLIEEYKRRHGEQTLMGFSCGKDSIAAALQIRDHVEIIPMYYYIVPKLPMVEENLHYYEKHLFGGRKIIRWPQYRMLDWLETGVFQTMRTTEILDAGGFERPASNFQNYQRKLIQWTIEQEDVDTRALNALGVRANDSPRRRMSFQQYGALRASTQTWYPVWDYDKERLVDLIKKSGISLSPDYKLFGKSFDGLTAQYLIPIKKHRPEDYKIILNYYPLAEVEVWKYERVHGKAAA